MKSHSKALLLALLLLLTSCLEIDGQDIYVQVDEENDRIDAMIVYRGMFAEASSGNANPVEKAINDLKEAQESGVFTFWNNWPFTFDPIRDYGIAGNALLEHLDVENGGLFTTPKGVLCGYQFLRVNNAKSFIQKLNLLVEASVQAEFVRDRKGANPPRQFDEETQDNVREFLRAGKKFIALKNGRIVFFLPTSDADHQWLKLQLEESLLEGFQRDLARSTKEAELATPSKPIELRDVLSRAPSFRFFWDNPFSFQRAENLTTIGLGVAAADELHVQKRMEGLYEDAYLQRLRAEKFQIEDGLPDPELGRRFADFRSRKAKLPPKLAQKRQ